ncbi:MAG: type II secretion system protein [Planctomycetota bacterium]
MQKRHAFTLTDLLASIACVAILLTITAATLADHGTNRQRQHNSTQLRGIHQGLVTFANSNKEKFPGLSSRGRILPNDAEDTGSSGDGDTPEARYWIMLTGNFFAPEWAIAPIDERAVEYDPGDGADPLVTYENYSFAMLDISARPGEPEPPREGRNAGRLPDVPDRAAEWCQSLNTQAIVLSNRNCADLREAGTQPFSIWNDDVWHGAVLWNDNHVEYTDTHIFETRYGSGQLNTRANGDGYDNLFTTENEDGSDALMTFSKDEDGHERAVPRVIEDDEEGE